MDGVGVNNLSVTLEKFNQKLCKRKENIIKDFQNRPYRKELASHGAQQEL